MFAVAGLLSLGFGACASKEPAAAPTAKPPSAIDVTLHEWEISPNSPTGGAGKVRFAISNTGKEIHEFVVVKTDLEASALPTKKNGTVDEDKVNGLGEVEDLKPGKSKTLKLTLTPGSYVFMCNRFDEDDNEAHYKLGMRTAFSVR